MNTNKTSKNNDLRDTSIRKISTPKGVYTMTKQLEHAKKRAQSQPVLIAMNSKIPPTRF